MLRPYAMFTGPEIVATLTQLGVTHVVWLPDSLLGTWEDALDSALDVDLIRVCREGEAWPLAAGLYLGGKSPVVMIQTTGLFESGDSMRNVICDMNLPLFAIVGARSYLVENSTDSAKTYAEPILRGWQIDYCVIAKPADKSRLAEHYHRCQQTGQAGAVLMAEGSM